MSFDHGWAAINLEMPPRVPRTEYSADFHWDLVRAVTGIEADDSSPRQLRTEASKAFMKAWNYDFLWNTMVGDQYFGERRTKMGHAVYQASGGDYADEVSCPFGTPEEALSLDVEAAYPLPPRAELVKAFEENYRASSSMRSDAVNMTGTYVSCMSGLISLFGWDMLLTAAGTDPDRFGALADRYGRWMMHFYEALAESDVPMVMIHDDIVWTSGPFIHPDWYRRYLFPNLKRYIAPLKEAGKKVAFTSDGDYSLFIDDVAASGVDCFVMEPMTDMGAIAERYGKTHSFVGNADTRILLFGGKADIEAEVRRCMDVGKSCPGFFMAVGNHIPPNTPVENVLWYNEIYEQLSKR
jgi:hypothetical protein